LAAYWLINFKNSWKSNLDLKQLRIKTYKTRQKRIGYKSLQKLLNKKEKERENVKAIISVLFIHLQI
jgi:hypothetical protein